MQVYGFLEKAQLENVTSDLSNTLAGLIWFNTTDSRARFYDGGAIRSVVDENSTQTLTGKTLTGNILASFSPDGVETITAPVVSGALVVDQHTLNYLDYLHQTTPSAPAAGGIRIYSKNDNQLYKQDSEGNEVPIGTGGGGLDVFHIEDFEVNNAADFSTGNNASFLGGGSLAGTLADETASPMAGNRTLKYTQAAGSLNDYFASPVIDLDEKQAGNFAGVSLYFKYSGDADDIKVVVYDVTNAGIISKSLDLIKDASNPTRFSVDVFIPIGVTQIRWGAQVVVENAGAILELDDVQFTSDPFTYKNLVQVNAIMLEGSDGRVISSQTEDVHFTGSGNGWFSSGDDHHYKVQNPESVIQISTSVQRSADGANRVMLFKNDVFYKYLSTGSFTNINYYVGQYTSVPGEFVKDDELSIRLDAGGTLLNNTETHFLNIVESVQAEHVVTPARSDFGSYYASGHAGYGSTNTRIAYMTTENSNTLGELGSVDNSSTNGFSFTANKRLMVKVRYRGKMPSGTDQLGLSLNSNQLTTNPYNITPANLIDYDIPSQASQMASLTPSLIMLPGDVLRLHNTNSAVTDSELQIDVINMDSKILSANPVQRTAYIDPTSNYISSVAGTTSYKTIPLLNVSGDSEIVSIDSNQLTLSKGKYEVVFPVGGYNSTSVVDALIYNITDSQNYEEFLNASFHGGGTSTAYSLTDVKTTIEITSTKTFEFRTKSLTGIGAELFGRIKITKIR